MINDIKYGMKRFFLSNTFYAIFNTSFIYFVLVPFIRSKNYDSLQLSSFKSIEAFFWFIFLYISGFMFDRLGARITFVIGRIIDLFAIILLLNPTYTNIVLSMIMFGLSKGVNYGKYTSFIYNCLSLKGKLHIYPRLASAYYFTWDIAISFVSFISSLVLKNHGYEIIIYMSIAMKILAIISIFILIPSNTKLDLSSFKSESIKSIFTTAFNCIKKSKIFAYLLIFYGLLNFFTYPLCITIGDMILFDKGFTASDIARYTTFIITLMAIGNVLPITFFPNGIKVKSCVFISLIQMILMAISAVFYNIYAFIIISGSIGFTFSLLEVSVEKKFEEYSNKKIRGSIISFSISIGTILQVFNLMLIGLIAKHISYHIGLIVVVLPMILLLFILNKTLKKID